MRKTDVPFVDFVIGVLKCDGIGSPEKIATKTISEVAKELGMTYGRFYSRFNAIRSGDIPKYVEKSVGVELCRKTVARFVNMHFCKKRSSRSAISENKKSELIASLGNM